MPSGNRLRPTLAGLLAVVLAASACGSDTAKAVEVKSSVARANANAAEVAATAKALDAFTGALYGKVAADAAGNVVVSPYSVAMALGMTRAGAVGPTRAQLDAALHNTSTSFDAGLNAIDQTLTSRTGDVRQGDKTVKLALRTANALWPQKGYPFQQAYLDTLAANYGAALHTVDYAKTEAARQAINTWVADQTNDKIENLIAEGVLSPLVRLVLTNAVYLNAPWSTPFDERSTAAAPFTRLDKSVVTADFMHASEPTAYAKGAGWQAVELPYAGEKLAMDIIVPDTGTFASVDAQLAQGLSPFVSSLKTTPLQLAMPKFRFRTQTNLVDVLKALGVTDLFDPDRADLSGMTSAEKLFVSDVIHEAFIDVRESGTEAAAATAVVIKATAAPVTPTALMIDRPFLFAIRDVETNTAVFIGRVVDPTAG